MLRSEMRTYWRAFHYGLHLCNLVVWKYVTAPVYWWEDDDAS